jgi:hypothetical protein
LPLQGRLQGPHDLQRLFHRALERRALLPHSGGHPCIGCSEDGFWDKGSFYNRLETVRLRHRGQCRHDRRDGRRAIGLATAAHAAVSAVKRAAMAPATNRPRRMISRTGLMTTLATPNGFTLDTGGKRLVIDPVTRIEGHMRCEVNIDSNNMIRNAVSTGTMWRGLEVILKGRDPRDAWAFVQRICGVCTGTHALTSVRGGKCAEDRHSRKRQFDPQHHAALASGA